MKISIVTPTYNSAKYIKDTLESIHSQSYKNFEHIVMDGLSIDNTIGISKSFPQVKVVSENDKGQSDALNKGFDLSSGDILAWQNADDLYLPGAFQTVVDFFKQHPYVDVVYGYYQLIDSESKWLCDVFPIKWDEWKFAHGRFVPLQPTVFWRRKVYEAVGILNQNLHYCMDVDFFSRIVNKGFKFALIPEMLGQFRVHTQSKTQNSLNEKKVHIEYKNVLASNFKYTLVDYLFFEVLQYRAKIAKSIKVKFLRKV